MSIPYRAFPMHIQNQNKIKLHFFACFCFYTESHSTVSATNFFHSILYHEHSSLSEHNNNCKYICRACVHAKSLQSCLNLVRQAPLFMGILQKRILEWVTMPPSSRGSSRPRDRTYAFYVSCTGRQVLCAYLGLKH